MLPNLKKLWLLTHFQYQIIAHLARINAGNLQSIPADDIDITQVDRFSKLFMTFLAGLEQLNKTRYLR